MLTRSDALRLAERLNSGIADIVFLDPPFNLGKNYGIGSKLEGYEPEEYEAYMKHLLHHMVRTLKPGGALFLYHLPYWASRLSQDLHKLLEFRHWIAVAMKSSFARGNRLYPAHYGLLYFTKGTPSVFHRPKLQPKRCRSCRALVKDYGGYTSIIEQKGINLSDVWDDLSPVRHKVRKNSSGNELPTTLTDRVVSIAGTPGGLLLDPFAGSGTCLVSASAVGMTFLGNDSSQKALDISLARLRRVAAVSASPPTSPSRTLRSKGGTRA